LLSASVDARQMVLGPRHHVEQTGGDRTTQGRRGPDRPYSPQLPPIELCRSKLKTLLRRAGARPRAALDAALCSCTVAYARSFPYDDCRGNLIVSYE